MRRSTAPAATWKTGSRNVSSIVRRPHFGGDDARQPAAPVVCVDGLCAAVRLTPPGVVAHPIRQGDLRHDPPQAVENRRAGAHQRAPHHLRDGLELSLPARLRHCPRTTDQRGGVLTNRKRKQLYSTPIRSAINASARTRPGCAPSLQQRQRVAAAFLLQTPNLFEKSGLVPDATDAADGVM